MPSPDRAEIQVVESVASVRDAVSRAKQAGYRVGFVPTMGALHVGHVSLMERARTECGYVAVSIFVNPTQFGPTEDFNRYPRPREADLAICREAGADLVFYPTVETMYPVGHRTFVEVAGLSEILEGAIRPGHFRGVTTVVTKLFNIVQADRAYFGQKDYQQQSIIRVMAQELDLPTEVVTCETVRDPDGLALSSRNAYLSASERQSGLAISRALRLADRLVTEGERDIPKLESAMRNTLDETPGLKREYAVIVNHLSLKELKVAEPRMVALVAVRVGTTRLIDNMILRLPGGTIS